MPLSRFKANLKAILSHPNILAHSPRIILITTPPVDEYQLKDDYRPDGKIDKGRCAENAQAYAQACREVGEELIKEGADLAICDLWSAMMEFAEWKGEYKLPGSLHAEQNSHFSQMLHDGMYLLLFLSPSKCLDELHGSPVSGFGLSSFLEGHKLFSCSI